MARNIVAVPDAHVAAYHVSSDSRGPAPPRPAQIQIQTGNWELHPMFTAGPEGSEGRIPRHSRA